MFVFIFNPKKILALIMVCSAASAFAELNLPNPLIEPAPRKKSVEVSEHPSALPPLPTNLPGSDRSLLPFVDASDAAKKDASLSSSAKALFSGYGVSAVVGDKAILRRSIGSSSVSPSLSSGQMSLPGQAPTSSGESSAKSESLIVTNGELVELSGADGTYIAKVESDRVTIFYGKNDVKKGTKRVVVYAGGIESFPLAQKPIVLQAKDADTKRNLIVKAGGSYNSQSSSSTSSPQSPQMPMQ
jgi:hypothetical protein